MTSSDDLTRQVLDAARAAYAKRGYVETTVKGVAAAAGVAPDVVRRYYANREALFAAAMRLPVDPATSIAQLLAPGIDGLGERMVRVTLRMLDDPETREHGYDAARNVRRHDDSYGVVQFRSSARKPTYVVERLKHHSARR